MNRLKPLLLPGVLILAAAGLLAYWLLHRPGLPMVLRVPGADHAPENALGTNANAVLAGKLIPGTPPPLAPAPLAGAWPQFRGPQGDGISHETTRLARQWTAGQPAPLWAIDVGEGYAGPAVLNGKVYLIDYDREKKQDAFRCLSLANGQEIWRFAYPVSIKRFHGMSRTVPSVNARVAVALGPKCHVACLNPDTGQLLWGIDLVQEYGTAIPQWYAGQCPLLENGRVILAPAGKEVLMLALDELTGKTLWRTPNPRSWNMTHSSITPAVIAGVRQYIYCGHGGVAGVSAETGEILWDTTDWKIGIATVPTPIVVGEGHIFFTGGYNAGSLMLEVARQGDKFVPRTLFRLKADVFGATQQTPVLYENHLYGVRADGAFVCLSLDGKVVWTSDKNPSYGLGPFLVADGLIFALNDSGLLRLIEASPRSYNLLAQAQVLQGSDCWGPMALVGGKLLARDLTRMVCLDVSAK